MNDDDDSFLFESSHIKHKQLSFGEISFFPNEDRSVYMRSNFDITTLSEDQNRELAQALDEFFENHNCNAAIHVFEDNFPITGIASVLLDACLNPVEAHDLRRNLEDLMPTWIERHGLRRANFVLNANIVFSLLGKLVNKIRDITDLLMASFPRMD